MRLALAPSAYLYIYVFVRSRVYPFEGKVLIVMGACGSAPTRRRHSFTRLEYGLPARCYQRALSVFAPSAFMYTCLHPLAVPCSGGTAFQAYSTARGPGQVAPVSA